MPSPAQAATDLCGPRCLSDAAMEGDKKRKRARSDPGLSRIPDSAGEPFKEQALSHRGVCPGSFAGG